MSKPTKCDTELMKAASSDPKVKSALDNMNAAQAKFMAMLDEKLRYKAFESEIPSPAAAAGKKALPLEPELTDADMERMMGMDAEWAQSKDAADWAKKIPGPGAPKEKAIEMAWNAWNRFKQMRAATFLSSPWTHIKNITSTGGMALYRPIEEAFAVAVSHVTQKEARSATELVHYAGGMMRGASDVLGLFGALGKEAARKGAFDTASVQKALQGIGYNPKLARGKIDLILETGDITKDVDGSAFAVKGAEYLWNVAFGSQFSALQGMDTAFKLISHRATVQQRLSRMGYRQGMKGERLDEFVSINWDRMDDAVRTGRELPSELKEIENAGITQAARDTFTETPQTKLGRILAGHWDTRNPWMRALSETMQIVSPFRSIYVNLMRQSLSTRLLPFVDSATRAAFAGKLGPEAKTDAIAKTAAAWTTLVGTSTLAYQLGLKIHGPSELDPVVREQQFNLYGKVGNTVEMAGNYYPLDGLPPNLSIPLTYTAALHEGFRELNSRYVDPEDYTEQFLRSFGPFIKAVTDGPWIMEYTTALDKLSWAFQSGDVRSIGSAVADLSVGNMKMPAWAQELGGNVGIMDDYSPAIKNAEGLWNTLMANLANSTAHYGLRMNILGDVMTPLKMHGRNAENVWTGVPEDMKNFMKAMEIDKAYTSNFSPKISGDAKGEVVPVGRDTVDMTPQMQEQYERYVGKSRLVKGMNMQETIEDLMYNQGAWNKENGTLAYDTPFFKLTLQTEFQKILAERRAAARELIKYNPKFGVREQQIEKFHRIALANGVDPVILEKIRQEKYNELNQVRSKLNGQF